jgi:hypothetical protein
MKQTGPANLAVFAIIAALMMPIMTPADRADSSLRFSSQLDKDASAAAKRAMLSQRAETYSHSLLKWGWEVKLAPRRGRPAMFAMLQSNPYRTDTPA